jgi:hypothetical protein
VVALRFFSFAHVRTQTPRCAHRPYLIFLSRPTLQSVKFGTYEAAFRAEVVGGDTLLVLDDEELVVSVWMC